MNSEILIVRTFLLMIENFEIFSNSKNSNNVHEITQKLPSDIFWKAEIILNIMYVS
jgi:hypothetical protein